MSSTDDQKHLVVFQNKSIRRIMVDDEWFFSVIDVIAVLTDSTDPGAYWRKLKQRLIAEGSQVVTNCHGLKLPAPSKKAFRGQEIIGYTENMENAFCGI